MTHQKSPHPAPGLRAIKVREVMSAPIVTCTPDMPLEAVAELMTTHRIHCVVVLAPDIEDAAPAYRRWGVLSDLDLVAAAPWGEEVADAGSVAATPQVVIEADRSLAEGALMMSEYATAHLLVIEKGVDEPVGILSALDVATALAPPPAPRPAPARVGGAVEPGDRLVITAHHQGERPRDAEVLEVRGADGGPPYLVRWEDTGQVSLHYPGSDAAVQRLGHR